MGIPAIGLLVSGAKWEDVIKKIKSYNIRPELIQSAKFLVIYPFTYHTVNGIRHLVCVLGGRGAVYTVWWAGGLCVCVAFCFLRLGVYAECVGYPGWQCAYVRA